MQKNKWIIRFQKNNLHPPALRLFCFPFAGGGASVYRTWQSTLPEQIEVCAIQLPGRENRIGDPLIERLTPLVDVLYDEITGWLDFPYAFFGHSMGAKIAFELACRLVKKGYPTPHYLFLAGSRPPHIAEPFLRHRLPDQALMDELRILAGTDESVIQNEMLMEMYLPILRADFALDETHLSQKKQRLSVPMAVFGGDRDRDLDHSDLARWRECSSGDFHLQMFSGDHFFVKSRKKELLTTLVTLLQPTLNMTARNQISQVISYGS
jgi:medium-chain acyl-[acyl-carrier-protein] hydrolase